MSFWSGRKNKAVKETTDNEPSALTTELAVSTSDQQLARNAKPAAFESDPTEGEYHVKILHDPEIAVVDIVFVHGLTGNRENTWTRNAGKKNACFWPQDLLPDADTGISNARIATWGYDADVINTRPFKVVSNNTIEQHAANLCTDLANIRGGSKANRPLIFVVHSLGGLVVKTALLHANECRTQSTAHLSAVVDSTTGIIFMGTPHRGSEQAHWGGILASVLGYVKQDNVELVKRLNKEEARLALLQERFMKLLEVRKEKNKPVNITCFYEELPVPVLGTIVPVLSAQIDPYPAVGIHENHMNMTKFGGDDSAGYIKVLGELRRFVPSESNANTTARNTEQSGEDPNTGERQANSSRRGGGDGGINFYGDIQGDKVIAGTYTKDGGTTNFTFN